jgi:hypothetical protein
MKDIPGIGTAKGVFDIFVPGVFLLLHVVAFIVLCAGSDPFIRNLTNSSMSSTLLTTAAFVCFGYLVGVLLRLLKTEMPDKLSGLFCAFLWRKSRAEGHTTYLKEPFPFFEYLKHVTSKKLPPDAHLFFMDCWSPCADKSKSGNRQFFNYCKLIINAEDERSGTEVYAAEAMTRYVSSMFYALLGAMVLTILMAISLSSTVLYFIAVAYVFAVLVILWNLRLLRFKEAEAIFAVTFHNHRTGKSSISGKKSVAHAGVGDGRILD